MTPDPHYTLLGGRQRPRSKRLPYGHRFCPQHPERYIPALSRGGIRCWLCEEKDEEAFAELDRLIACGLEAVPQLRITPEMVEQAETRKEMTK